MLFYGTLLIAFIVFECVQCLGLNIPPVSSGDPSSISNLENLKNCVNYATLKDDFIMVKINSGDTIPSQHLNLRIFDSENNLIRSQSDLKDELELIFTSFQSPKQIDHEGNAVNRGEQILNRLPLVGKKKDSSTKNGALEQQNIGESWIHICFDNIFVDRSWSFTPQDREVELHVDIKNINSIKETNYKVYAMHFQKFKQEKSELKNDKHMLVEEDLSKVEFEKYVKILEGELDDLVEKLSETHILLLDLVDQEVKLRDTNEAIFESYTYNSIVLLSTIGIFGVAQLIYFRFFLKRRKVI